MKQKHRIISEKLMETLVNFIGDIQLNAAEESDYITVDHCNVLLDELLNTDRAVIKGKISPKKDEDDFMRNKGYYGPYSFSKFTPDEMKYLYDSFKRISDELSREKHNDNQSNKFKKSKKTKSIKNLVDTSKFKKMSLKNIENYLLSQKDLTDEERFELYYDEYKRVKEIEDMLHFDKDMEKILKKLNISKRNAKK